jgi:uncharacterized protein (TIGR02246 family)
MQPDPNAVAKLANDYTAAWNSGSPDAVAAFFAADGEIIINCGEPWKGRAQVAEMAAGFFADVPDLSLTCDEIRCAGSHAVYVWTFTGHDAATGHPLEVRGWEEWDLDGDSKIRSSRGWYDAEDYASQVAGGIDLGGGSPQNP